MLADGNEAIQGLCKMLTGLLLANHQHIQIYQISLNLVFSINKMLFNLLWSHQLC